MSAKPKADSEDALVRPNQVNNQVYIFLVFWTGTTKHYVTNVLICKADSDLILQRLTNSIFVDLTIDIIIDQS